MRLWRGFVAVLCAVLLRRVVCLELQHGQMLSPEQLELSHAWKRTLLASPLLPADPEAAGGAQQRFEEVSVQCQGKRCPHQQGVCCAEAQACCANGFQCRVHEGVATCHASAHSQAKSKRAPLLVKGKGAHCSEKEECGYTCRDFFFDPSSGGCEKGTHSLPNIESQLCHNHGSCQTQCCSALSQCLVCNCKRFHRLRGCPAGVDRRPGTDGLRCKDGSGPRSCPARCCASAQEHTCEDWSGQCRFGWTRQEHAASIACQGKECHDKCCKPSNTNQVTCADWTKKQGSCPASHVRVEGSGNDRCPEDEMRRCPEVCCTTTRKQELHKCRDWRKSQGKCRAGANYNVAQALTECEAQSKGDSKTSCQRLCCQDQQDCSVYLEEHRCPSNMHPNPSKRSSMCRSIVCDRPPCKLPHCKTECCRGGAAHTCEGFQCPAGKEERKENRDQPCDGKSTGRSDSCLSLCCKGIARSETCRDWKRKRNAAGHTLCPAGADLKDGSLDSKCSGLISCRAQCCKQPTCRDWRRHSQCPANSKDKDNSAHLECDARSCPAICCRPKRPTCEDWVAKSNAGRAGVCGNEALLKERGLEHMLCQGDRQCRAKCCQPQTCKHWKSAGGRCAGPVWVDKPGTAGARCNKQQCPTLCCRKVHTCRDFMKNRECPSTHHVRPEAQDTECEGDQCLDSCCETYRCDDWREAGGECANPSIFVETRTRQFCKPLKEDRGQDCQRKCCTRDLVTCRSFLLEKGCPTERDEPVRENEGKTCQGQQCAQLCCRVDRTCKHWREFENGQCGSGRRPKPNTDAVACTGAECRSKCCHTVERTCKDWLTDGRGEKCRAPQPKERTDNTDFKCGNDEAKCRAECCTGSDGKLCRDWLRQTPCGDTFEQNQVNLNKDCQPDLDGGAKCKSMCCKRKDEVSRCEDFKENNQDFCKSIGRVDKADTDKDACEDREQCGQVCCQDPERIEKPADCMLWGDPHVVTFDKEGTMWRGPKSFTTKAAGSFVTMLDPQNDQEVQHHQDQWGWITSVAFKSGDSLLIMKLPARDKFDPTILVNGVVKPLARSISAGDLTLSTTWTGGAVPTSGARFTVSSARSKTVITIYGFYNHQEGGHLSKMELKIHVTGYFKPPMTSGWCGRFDGDVNNEYYKPDGSKLTTTTTNGDAMARSWAVGSSGRQDLLRGHTTFRFVQVMGGEKDPESSANPVRWSLALEACAACKGQAKRSCAIDVYASGDRKDALPYKC